MKKWIYFLAVALLPLSCGPASQLTRITQYSKMYEEKPVTLLVMPPINNTTDVEAKEFLYTSISRPLIEAGYVYFAMPPLYTITIGKKVFYAYMEEEKKKIIDEYAQGDEGKVVAQRYKGLGEMEKEELWETTMNPETRMIGQVTLSDAEEADRVFSMLMGEDVEPRREFIEQNVTYVSMLDI